jgi:hypothetical protein
MCEGEGILGQKQLHEELNVCLTLMDQHCQNMKKDQEGWNTSEEEASTCKHKNAEHLAQLAFTTEMLGLRDADIESMRRGS